MKYGDKTAMVISHPLFLELAVRLARDFGRVLYWNPGADATFPTMNQGMIGHGLEGIECVDSWAGEHFDSVDIFIFPDLYQGPLQVYLEGIGKRVWGSRHGEELEIYRGVCKDIMEGLGLPVQPWKTIKGIAALRDHLRNHPKQHVKVDRWRGNFETFFAENYKLVEPKLDEIAHAIGAFQHLAEFTVEDDLPDLVESGIDAYCIDGRYPQHTLTGIEVKDLGYMGQFMPWASIPEPLRRWHEKMAPTFARYGYRGFLSNEVRIGKDHVPYMIDACCRAASPPSELYQEFYTNLAEIIWEGADGVLVEPQAIAKFGLQIVMRSSWAENNWQPVEFPSDMRRFVKLYNPVKIEGKYYVVPQDDNMAEIGSIIAYGDTLDSAFDMLDEVADTVTGYGIKIPRGAADDARAQAEKLAEIGLPLFDIEKTESTK